MSLKIVSPGVLTLIQDEGRPGFGSSGVSPSGAFDRAALRQANLLVGNPGGAPALEILGGGLQLRATREHVLAVTGAVGSILIGGHPVEHGRSLTVFADQDVTFGAFDVGLRAYLAVAGGVMTDEVLGSAATDTLSGLGPSPVAGGTKLRCGFASGPPLDGMDIPALIASGSAGVDIVLGPREDWFTQAAVERLMASAWTVTPTSNRIGIRLDGPVLERSRDGEIPSEPCVFGSIQVTSAGLPVVLGPDHPVTGGYPVIAVVADRHLDRLAQVRPGEILRFRRG
jgi:biotin-dependent carboxylase-like uncharacterized protein